MTRERAGRDKKRVSVTPARPPRWGDQEAGQRPRQPSEEKREDREVIMIEAFMEGGWGMWPVLVFGMVSLGAALRFALKPDMAQLRFIGAILVTTLVSTIHATWTCFGAVFRALEDPQRVADAELTRTMYAGFKESTRPGSMGGLLITLACLLVAVGMLRAQRKGEKA
jgi:hypothetical protein